jgi:TPR repeat protein
VKSYYTVAAKLGDPDAQSDLAFCLANGKGCKKDKKEAAKWYRAAVCIDDHWSVSVLMVCS